MEQVVKAASLQWLIFSRLKEMIQVAIRLQIKNLFDHNQYWGKDLLKKSIWYTSRSYNNRLFNSKSLLISGYNSSHKKSDTF